MRVLEQDILELFNERVAIMTIDGEQAEDKAIRHAYRIVRERFGRVELPKEIVDAVKKSIELTPTRSEQTEV